jgi:hypothetical protein
MDQRKVAQEGVIEFQASLRGNMMGNMWEIEKGENVAGN